MSTVSEQNAIRTRWPVLSALTVLVLASALPFTNYLLSALAYGAVFAAYLLFCGVTVFLERKTELEILPWALLTLGVVWVIYVWHLYLDIVAGTVTVGALVRVPPFVVLTGLNIFYIPRVVSREAFFAILARVAAALVLVGLPTLFVDSYSLGLVDVVSYRGADWPFGPGGRNAVSSVFANPNTMSYVAMVGLLAACGEYLARRRLATLALAGLNGVGLYLAHGRADMLAAVAGVGVFVTYFLVGRHAFRTLYVLGGVVGVWGLLVVFNYLPGPSILSDIKLQGRNLIWAGGIRAVLSQPVFGFGAGETGQFTAPFTVDKFAGFTPHSSYLRVFVETGIVGGTAYVLFVGRTLFGRLFNKLEPADLTTLALCTGVAISMVFRGYTLFGISIMSLLSSIIFGYGIRSAMPDHRDGASGPVADDSPTSTQSTPHSE